MAQPALSLNFRVASERRDTADQSPGFVASKVLDALRAAGEKKGLDVLMAAIEANQATIIDDVVKDAQAFGAATARVMTKIKSPGGGSVSIALDGISRRSAITSTDSASSKLKGKTTVEWVALSQKTLRNKANRRKAAGLRGKGDVDTFFVDSGKLKKVLDDYLGDAFGLLTDPKVVVKRGQRKATVTLSIMAQASGKEKAGVTGESFPGASSIGATAREETLFVRYLKRAGAKDDARSPLGAKLSNPRGQQRPFLQNALVFWITNRLPSVLEASLKRSIAKTVKKKGK